MQRLFALNKSTRMAWAAAIFFLAASANFAQQALQISPPAPASPPSQALTLAEAMKLALAFSPQIAANQQELAASEGAVIQAGARPNPEIQALLEDTRRQTRTTTLQLNHAIELGGKRSARVSVAELGQAQTAVEVDARRAQIRADVSDAFFAAAIAQERVQLAQVSADLAARGTDAASKRVQAGKISPVDETRARVAQASVQLELLQAQGALRATRQHLAALLGPASAPRVESLAWRSLDRPGLRSLDATALAQAPALRLARLELDKRRAMVDLERARAVPDVTVTLGAKRDAEAGRNQAVIGLAMPIPVLDTNRGHILQALRLVDKAEADLQATQIRVDTEWTQLSETQRTAQAEVQMLQTEVLPSAESAWQAATTGFELGKFSFLDALDAQRTLLQARAQYLRSLNELYRSTANIDRLLGTSDHESTP